MNVTYKHLLSETISFLRFPLIVGVVFIHTSIDVSEIDGQFDQWEFVDSVMYFFSQVSPAVCVPLFFFISGFLFFYNSDWGWYIYIGKLKRRIRTLLVPYVIWNLVGFVVLMLRMNLKWAQSLSPSTNIYIDISTFLNCFFMIAPSESTPPFNFPLWFVRDLMVAVISSPLIYWFIKKFKLLFIIVLGLVWFFQTFNFLHFPEASYQSLFFFPLGAYFSIHQIDFIGITLRANWSIPVYLFFSFADLFCRNEIYRLYVHNIGILCGMLCFVFIVSTLLVHQKFKMSEFLCETSFFVFVSHGIIVTKIEKLLELVFVPQLPLVALLVYFFIPFLTISMCIVLYCILKRVAPVSLRVMVGGR